MALALQRLRGRRVTATSSGLILQPRAVDCVCSGAQPASPYLAPAADPLPGRLPTPMLLNVWSPLLLHLRSLTRSEQTMADQPYRVLGDGLTRGWSTEADRHVRDAYSVDASAR